MASSQDQNALWDDIKHFNALQSPKAFKFSDVLSKPDSFEYFLTHDESFVEPTTGGSDRELAFLASVLDIFKLERRMEMTSYRRFFCHLYNYDLLQLVRLNSPFEDREKPVEPKHVVDFLGPPSKVGDKSFDDQTVRGMNRDATYGKILDLFCQKFGNGSLFFLRDQLDDDFLSSNPPLVGTGIDEAFARLEHLGLGRKAQESRANELADSVRGKLIAMFKRPEELNAKKHEGEAITS